MITPYKKLTPYQQYKVLKTLERSRFWKLCTRKGEDSMEALHESVMGWHSQKIPAFVASVLNTGGRADHGNRIVSFVHGKCFVEFPGEEGFTAEIPRHWLSCIVEELLSEHEQKLARNRSDQLGLFR